jgi:hypothetical protein
MGLPSSVSMPLSSAGSSYLGDRDGHVQTRTGTCARYVTLEGSGRRWAGKERDRLEKLYLHPGQMREGR